MHKKIAATVTVLALFVMAGIALAQNADKNSAGPTKNDLKIRVIEPLEGATITGTSARVSVDYDRARYREQGNVDKGLDKFPPPTFSVFLDNDLKQTLKPGETVATVDNISPGSHKIVILAKNISGEVVDRKEININAVTVRMLEPVRPVAKEAAPREPASVPAYEPPHAPAPVEAPALPTTASHAPRLALAGLALIACGLLLARKAR
jgi:hypothetical protein